MKKKIYQILLLFCFMGINIFASGSENDNFSEIVKTHYFMIQRLKNPYIARVNITDKTVKNPQTVDEEIEVYLFPKMVTLFNFLEMMPRPVSQQVREIDLTFNCSRKRLSEGEFYVFGKCIGNKVVITDYISCKKLNDYANMIAAGYIKEFTSLKKYVLEMYEDRLSLNDRVINDFSHIQSQEYSKCELGLVSQDKKQIWIKLSDNSVLSLNKTVLKNKYDLIDNDKIIMWYNVSETGEVSDMSISSLVTFNNVVNNQGFDYYIGNFYYDSLFRKWYNFFKINSIYDNMNHDKVWTFGITNDKKTLTPAEACHRSGMSCFSCFAVMYKNPKNEDKIRKLLFWNNPEKFEWFEKNLDKLIEIGDTLRNKPITVRW